MTVTCPACGEEVEAALTPSQPASGPRGERPIDPPVEATLDPPDCPKCGAELDANEAEATWRDDGQGAAEDKADAARDDAMFNED